MAQMVIFYFCSVLLFLVWIKYNQWDDRKKYWRVLGEIVHFKTQLDELKKLVHGNSESVGKNTIRVTGFLERLEQFELESNVERSGIDVHFEKLRQGQIELWEALSKKRPIVKFNGLIPVEMHGGETLRATKKKKEK